MTNGGYILAGYLTTGLVLAVYSVRLLLRGRALSKQVAPEDRRWM